VLQLARHHQGPGRGREPEIGRQAALEDRDRIAECSRVRTWCSSPPAWRGTGTGAAPIVAEVARDSHPDGGRGHASVQFEGKKRAAIAAKA